MKRWRILLLTLCLTILCTLSVSAEKTDWVDKGYDFTKVQTVLVYGVKFIDTSEFDNDIMARALLDEYYKNAARPKYKLLDGRDMIQGQTEIPYGVDLYVTSELTQWHDDYYIKPGYTSWESREEKRRVRRHDGSWYEETYYTTVPVVHPPQRIDTSTVRMKFGVYDARTGQQVFAREDFRVRDDSFHGQKGMFGRICKSFFEDLGKKIKKE